MFLNFNPNKPFCVHHHTLKLQPLKHNYQPLLQIQFIQIHKLIQQLLERYRDLHYLLFQTIHFRTVYQVQI